MRRRNSYTHGYRRSKTIGYRHANIGDQYAPESKTHTDKNNNLNIATNYCVFVRINDCVLYEKEGRKYYNADKAPIIPITGHSMTFKAYGVPRLVQKIGYKELRTPVYMVERGFVYTKTIVQILWTGKVRPANYNEISAFKLTEQLGTEVKQPYVIDMGEDTPGIPILLGNIQMLQRKNIDFLSESILFMESEDTYNGTKWAKPYIN